MQSKQAKTTNARYAGTTKRKPTAGHLILDGLHNQGNPMFIREQMMTYREARADFIEDDVLDRHVWSPVSCRHCCWTFSPNPYAKLRWA